jgi:hypothetical protein
VPLSLQAPEKDQNEKDQSYKFFLRDNVEAIALCIVLIFAAFFCAFWQPVAETLTDHGTGEPLFVLQGVSLWPSTMLRALTALISVCLTVRAWRKLQSNLTQIADKIIDMATKPKWCVEILRTLRRGFDNLSPLASPCDAGQTKLDRVSQ